MTDDAWRRPKDDRLVPYGETNLGTPLDLVDDAVVPTSLFFVRSNYPIPYVEPSAWRLRVHGLVGRTLELTLDDVRAMPQRTVVGLLECSGNSRSRFEPATPGTPWRDDAVGTAVWSGVPVAHLLDLAEVGDDAVELISQGADDPRMRRGLPLRVARDPGTLLVLQMNGADLLPAHGAPARLYVPGWGGIASTKWVVGLELSAQRWNGLWNAEEYVLLDADGHETGRVEEMPVKSLLTRPAAGSVLPSGPVRLEGFAWSGRAPVDRVEVSVDGAPYAPAEIVERPGPRAWVRWAAEVDAVAGTLTVRVRAVDATGAMQPDVAAWNAKGYQMNAVTETRYEVAG